ncbi:MAG: glycosyltransferase [Chloroflexota bacterium]
MTQITIITGGSRGDVQPYVGLGKGLQIAGYDVQVVATDDFESLVKNAGLEFISTGESVQRILESDEWRDTVENGNFITIQKKMRDEMEKRAPIMAERLIKANENAEFIIGGMGLMGGGFSIVEKRNIPVINAHLFPLTPSSDIPSPILPNIPLGRLLNPITMKVTRQMLWQSVRTADTAVREQLGMPKPSFWGPFQWLEKEGIPTVYGYSRHVLPKSADWDALHSVVGYWFLDTDDAWQPPQELVDFLASGEPPVYIGFGSMRSKDAEQAGQIVLEALDKSGQRGVLASGWGGLAQSDVPDNIYMLSSIPHSWLFPRMKAVIHHGGAGTTAAGLRAGVPTIITPFFGDQPFWGKQVYELGIGAKPIPRKQLTSDNLADAIRFVTRNAHVQEQASTLAQKIHEENSITPVIRLIEQIG